MVKLLTILGTVGISAGAAVAAPVAIINSSETHLYNAGEKLESSIKLIIDNKKFQNGSTISTGVQSYKDEMINFIEQQREWKETSGVVNFKITNAEGNFPQTSEVGNVSLQFSTIENLINANNYEINDLRVEVQKLDNYGNFWYAIDVNGSYDGNDFDHTLYSYQPKQSLTDFQILGGYELTFETEYQIGESMDHTDENYMSNIQLPNLGTNFYAGQIKDIFNYDGNQYKELSVEYINETLNLNIENIDTITVSKAVKNGDNYTLGAEFADNSIVEDEYFFVSFVSSDASGTFNMIVKNV